MLIYSRSTGVVDIAAGSMKSYEIQAFNSQLTSYEVQQPTTSIKSLINTAIANNATYSGE